MIKYVSYLRVSTKNQGEDGFGIEAQRSQVDRFVAGNEIVKEFVEVESGTKGDRPILAEALLLCRTTGATLVVAKIDRLYRNVYFTAKLMESNVNFVCCDMPFADRMTIQLFAVLAEWEARRISERTKAAMEQVRVFGSKSGLPIGGSPGSKKFGKVGPAARYEKARSNPMNKMAAAFIAELKSKHVSSNKIATRLNDAGYLTASGKPFTSSNVNYIHKLFHSKEMEHKIQRGKELRIDMAKDLGGVRGYERRVAILKSNLANQI